MDAHAPPSAGPVLRIFATRDLAAGQELTDTYCNLFATRRERQVPPSGSCVSREPRVFFFLRQP